MGPYHPALPLPLALTFSVRGEKIVGVAPPETGYCRRGVEALVAGGAIDRALEVTEHSCSFAGHSHRLAVCRAIEAATGATPSASAELLRGVFCEFERMLARLWTLGMTARAAGVPEMFHRALEGRELLFDALESATGARVFWALATPGGTRELAETDATQGLRAALGELEPDVAFWLAASGTRGALGHASVGLARLTREAAAARGVTGLAARAAGVERDLRRDVPYGAYVDVADVWDDPDTASLAVPRGDAAARTAYAAADLATSLRLARAFLDALDGADETALAPSAAARATGGTGRGEVEGPHGQVAAVVTLGAGDRVAELHLETPGAALLSLLPDLLEGLPLARAPMVLAGLDLCVECVDL